MDDATLKFENSDDMISSPHGHSTCQYDNAGMDSLLMDKNLSVTESNGHIENALEVWFLAFYESNLLSDFGWSVVCCCCCCC